MGNRQAFVAIDFETANEKRSSACAIGLAKFDDRGNLVDTASSLIRPHTSVDYFNPVNTWIHGITASDVRDAPSWEHLVPSLQAFIGDLPLVAHNMAFDGYVLNDLTELYSLTPLTNRRMCTLRLARKILADELDSKSLDDVFDYYFPGEDFEHHDAGADALACGHIFARMQEEHGFSHLEELCPPPGARRHYPSSPSTVDKLLASELISRYGSSAAFTGEHICITGTLKVGQRAAVQELVKAMGATPDSNLTKKTTVLVVGTSDPKLFAKGASASRKLLKATALRDAGSRIEVLTEEEFFNRLADEE